MPRPTPKSKRPAREVIEHADLLDQPQRVVERQAVDARAEPDTSGPLAGRRQEDAGHRRQAERRHVVLGQMVRGEARGVVLLEQLQPALVELVERHALPAIEVIEDPQIHRASMRRPCRAGLNGYTPVRLRREAAMRRDR